MDKRLVDIVGQLGIDSELTKEEILDQLEIQLSQVNKRLLRKPDDEELKEKFNLLQEGIDLAKARDGQVIDVGLSERSLEDAGLTEKAMRETGVSERNINSSDQKIDQEYFDFIEGLDRRIYSAREELVRSFADSLIYASDETIEFFFDEGQYDADEAEAAKKRFQAAESELDEINSILTKLREEPETILGYKQGEVPAFVLEKIAKTWNYLDAMLRRQLDIEEEDGVAVFVYTEEYDFDEELPSEWFEDNDYATYLFARFFYERKQNDDLGDVLDRYIGEEENNRARYYRATFIYSTRKAWDVDELVKGFMDAYFVSKANILPKETNGMGWALKLYDKAIGHHYHNHTKFPKEALAYMVEKYGKDAKFRYSRYEENVKLEAMKENNDIVGMIQYLREQNDYDAILRINEIYESMNAENRAIIYEALLSDAADENRPRYHRVDLYLSLINITENEKTGTELDKERLKLYCKLSRLTHLYQYNIGEIIEKYFNESTAIGESIFSSLVKEGYAEPAIGLAVLARDGYPVRDLEKAKEMALIASSTVYEKEAEKILNEINTELSCQAILDRNIDALNTSKVMDAIATIKKLAEEKCHYKSAYILGGWYEKGNPYIEKDISVAARYYAMAIVYSRGRYKNVKPLFDDVDMGPKIKKVIPEVKKSEFYSIKTVEEYKDILANSYGWED